MEQIAQSLAPLQRSASLVEPAESSYTSSKVGGGEKKRVIPRSARWHVFKAALVDVVKYNGTNVSEQSFLWLSLASLAGMITSAALRELQARQFISPYDPLTSLLLPFLVIMAIWLFQEHSAIHAYGRKDPLTKHVRWRQIIKRLAGLDPSKSSRRRPRTGSSTSVSSSVVVIQNDARSRRDSLDDAMSKRMDDDDDDEHTDGDEPLEMKPTPPPSPVKAIPMYRREFTPAQEASILTLHEKYFQINSPWWTKTRFMCVNDDGRWAAIRALDARRWRVDQASVLIENNVKWRESERIDYVFTKVVPENELRTVRVAMGDGFFGLDRTGTPIYWCPAGDVHLASLKQQVPLENIVTVHIQLMEFNQRVWFRELSEAQHRCVYQSTCVLDLKGFSSKNTSGGFWDVMQAITTVDKDFYYENLFRVYSTLR